MLPSAAKAQGTEVRDIALSLVVVEVIALQAVLGVLTLVHSVDQAMLRPPSPSCTSLPSKTASGRSNGPVRTLTGGAKGSLQHLEASNL